MWKISYKVNYPCHVLYLGPDEESCLNFMRKCGHDSANYIIEEIK